MGNVTESEMRQRLAEIIRRQDDARGRPLTDRERLENLAAALSEDDTPCPLCGVRDNETCGYVAGGRTCGLESAQ